MKRGDLVSVAAPGDYGKPQPALVVQATAYAEYGSVTVLPLTSDHRDLPLLRIAVEPSSSNGLRVRSQVMVDKAVTVARQRTGTHIGQIEPVVMAHVDRALAVFLGLA